MARLHRPLLALLMLSISAFYMFRACKGGAAQNLGKTSEYYDLLTDAFLAGRTSLLLEPAPELLALPNPFDPDANRPYRLHDASLYHGKYYLYYGPTPALVLFLPFKLLTGFHLPNRVAVALFCMAGFLCSCALFFRLADRQQWICPFWLATAAVISLGASSYVFPLVTRPNYYEVAIGAGYFFFMAGLWLLAGLLDRAQPPWWRILLAGLCFGLLLGCRPHFALVAMCAAVLLACVTGAYPLRLLVFAFPIALCGAAIAAYNYARFHNPFDFGISYMLTAKSIDYATL